MVLTPPRHPNFCRKWPIWTYLPTYLSYLWFGKKTNLPVEFGSFLNVLEADYHGDQALEPDIHPCLITASLSCQDRFVIDSSLSCFCCAHLMTLSFHILRILQAVFLSPVSPALCPAFSAILLFSFYTTRLSPP